MTYKPYQYKAPACKPAIEIGPRTRREIELRVRELSARLNPTVHDRAERARLEELLRGGGG